MNIFLTFIKNPTAIDRNGTHDIRFDVFEKIAFRLKEKHRVFVMPVNSHCWDCIYMRSGKLQEKYIGHFEPMKSHFEKDIDLVISWDPLYVIKEWPTSIYKDKFMERTGRDIPFLSYEHGHMKDSIIIDGEGMFDCSEFANNNKLNTICEQGYNEKKCKAFMKDYLSGNKSKRKQEGSKDAVAIGTGESVNINNVKNYVFIPTQKADDVSLKASKIDVFQCLEETYKFCVQKEMPLVVKIHPHIANNFYREQFEFIKKFNDPRSQVYVSKYSINYLMQNARYTVCLNGASLMDNFINQTPVLSLAPSMYKNTDALIYSDNAQEGLSRIHSGDWDLDKMLDKQRKIIWWYINNNLSPHKTTEENIKVLENRFNLNLL